MEIRNIIRKLLGIKNSGLSRLEEEELERIKKEAYIEEAKRLIKLNGIIEAREDFEIEPEKFKRYG